MKKTIYAAFVFAALGLTACNSGEEKKEDNTESAEKKEDKVKAVKYDLVASESKLDWRGAWVVPGEGGEMKEVKNHEGFVNFSKGSVTTKGDEVSGSFTIDMTTITNTDLDEKSENLEKHLKGTREDDKGAFFNTPKFPTAKVELKSIKNGDANIVINVLGMEMEETVPVTTKMKGDKMMMSGDFAIDFEKLGFKMFSPNPEKPEEGNISSKIDFSLDVVLKK